MRAGTVLLLGCVVLSGPRGARAQVSLGPEIVVAHDAEIASVAMGAGGEFLMLWEDTARQSRGLLAQLFDREGRRGGEVQVSGPGSYLSEASAAMDQEGDFVVVWQFSEFSEETGAYGYHTGHHHLYGRRFNRVGRPAGAQFELSRNSGYGSTAVRPVVEMTRSGAFVVVWYANIGGGLDVRARRFDGFGRSLGEPVRANDVSFNHFWRPDVGIAEDGSFAVIWDYPLGPTRSPFLGVSGARVSASGARIRGVLEVVAPDDGRRGPAAVDSAADGSFVVVWADNERGIHARRYDARGSALGDAFLVNDRSAALEHSPEVSMTADGAFSVVWAVEDRDGGVFCQHFDSAGQPIGTEVEVARDTATQVHREPRVATGPGGSVVVAWQRYVTGARPSVLARLAIEPSAGGGGGGDPGGDTDRDGDGVIDVIDNCPTVPNPDQLDAAADGFGDECVSPDVALPPDLRLGPNPVIGVGTVIGNRVSIGSDAVLGEYARIDDDVTAGDFLVLGDLAVVGTASRLGDDVTIGPGSRLERGVTIGDDVAIGDQVDIRRNVVIGDRAAIGPLVVVFAGARIGADATVEMGARIGRRATVGPGARVPAGARVPPGAVVP